MMFGRFQMISLQAVIKYLWDVERRDYQDSPRSDHIFLDLIKLRVWLSSEERMDPLPMSTKMAARIAVGACPAKSEGMFHAAWQHLVDTTAAWRISRFVGCVARDLIFAGILAGPDCRLYETKPDTEV